VTIIKKQMEYYYNNDYNFKNTGINLTSLGNKLKFLKFNVITSKCTYIFTITNMLIYSYYILFLL
jgi:hypothetical protein